MWAEEPSVFELQDTNTQKDIQNLKATIEKQSTRIFELENNIKQLQTSLEGLTSIYEGQSTNVKDLSDKISNQETIDKAKDEELKNMQEQIATLSKNTQLLKDSLGEINHSINDVQQLLANELKTTSEKKDNQSPQLADDKVANDKVADKTNNNAINEAQTASQVSNPSSTQTSTEVEKKDNAKEEKDTKKDEAKKDDVKKDEKTDKTNDKFDATKRDEIFKEARSLTYSSKFEEAIERYKWLIKIDYKKAESNYMLGNIAYAQNRYNDAIAYYKESATLDDKASYMPRLLLNSANSFRVLKDNANAKKFYDSLVSLFPNSSEAKEAQKHIKKLQ